MSTEVKRDIARLYSSYYSRYNEGMLEVIEEASRKAGKILLNYFEKGVNPKNKSSHHDLITEADPEAQNAIISSITESLLSQGFKKSEFGFLAEEDEVKITAPKMFVIDPLDGTNNFASGLPLFCVSIAYFEDGKLKSGVVFEPLTDTLYQAEEGKGAFKIHKKKSTRLWMKAQPLEHVIVATTFTPTVKVFEFSTHLQPYVREVRILGSAALDLCLAAEGTVGVVARFGTKAWDIAAGHIILKEAGANVFDWDGEEVIYDLNETMKRYPHIACHPEVFEKIKEYMK